MRRSFSRFTARDAGSSLHGEVCTDEACAVNRHHYSTDAECIG